MRATYSLAQLPVSEAAFDEIKNALEQAGWGHSMLEEGIDMTGIMLVEEIKDEKAVPNHFITPSGFTGRWID